MTLRIALSGSAGTGKTTLARELARRLGLPLIPEAMRAYLEAGGKRLDRIPRPEAEAILAAFRTELEAEEARLGAFVADNGILDLQAYTRWYGCLGTSNARIREGRYDAVVILPAGVLPYEQDGIRQDDPIVETRFQSLLERIADASALEPALLRVPSPIVTVEARVEWVLARLHASR